MNDERILVDRYGNELPDGVQTKLLSIVLDVPVDVVRQMERPDPQITRLARRAARARAEYKCEKCKTNQNLHLHHRTYERFPGRELPEDFELLCSECHMLEHARLISMGKPLRRPKPRTTEPTH